MNVKELREKLGLTQEELAANTGIPRDRIAKWEQGKGAPKANDAKILEGLLRNEGENIEIEHNVQLANNIRLIRELSGKTQTVFGNRFHATKDMIISYEKGRAKPNNLFLTRLSEASGIPEADLLDTPLKESDIKVEILEKVFHVPPNVVNLSDQTNGNDYVAKRRELKNEAKKRVPFYDAPAAAGMTETEMTAIHAPAGTIDVGDLLNDSQAAIRIYGNSMLPNYPPGCVVGLAKCDSLMIEPGEVYVIETRTRRILKRLFYPKDKPESEKITCYSDNIMKFEGGARDGQLAYPPYDMPKKEIINLFVVTGVIKRNANSVIINR